MSKTDSELAVETNIVVGNILVENGSLTREQLAFCLQRFQAPGNRLPLGDIALIEGFVCLETLEKALKTRDAFLASRQAQRTAPPKPQQPKPPPETKIPPVPLPPPTPGSRDSAVLIKWLVSGLMKGYSDIHLKSGKPLIARYNGELEELKTPAIDTSRAESILFSLLKKGQIKELRTNKSIGFCMDLPGGARARVSIFFHKRGIDGAFRLIPKEIPTLESLHLPKNLAKFTTYPQGLVLVTGPASSGKSSTLAALVNIINKEHKRHIITVEDPIEFIHESDLSQVTSRQVGVHTHGVTEALRAAFREDPDVIVVGEMHNLETARLTMSAAETGHLVFATLHTRNAVQSVSRVIDMFPPEEQSRVRIMLSESLRGVISQRLVPRADGTGRIPIVEIMFSSTAVGNMIREKKAHQIPNLLKISKDQGNTNFEDCAISAFEEGLIDVDVLKRFRSA